MSFWNGLVSPFDELYYILEDSNEDDMTLDADDGPDDTNTQSTDNSNGDESSDDTSSDDTQTDDENNNETSEDNSDENTEGNDMDLDPDSTEGDENSDGSSDEGEGTDDSMGDDSSMGGEEEIDQNDPNARLKELEKSIFDQLSKEQKALKTKELKSLYDIVYNKCTDIINTISGAERSPEQAKIYDYVMNSLTDLQKYIKDYLMQIFDSKTYIENMVQLQKYLTVLDTVSNIFEEVKKSSEQQNTSN